MATTVDSKIKGEDVSIFKSLAADDNSPIVTVQRERNAGLEFFQPDKKKSALISIVGWATVGTLAEA
ncbi:hypothetical protein EDB81DRAFT_893631 [Dactylonectria macrodidyma]|uniref:Uncharacterized protein n=1 Tax=Dactylonectria macrodidyma TaxID=307937 RepID=A0A9P9D630_9HYPO|nr:hypothetical protein EDB81DRAFT_893631 [Dactylonectria macrodidyma]